VDQASRRAVIERCYAAFNSRDLNAALAGLHPNVDWPNALDGGRVLGHEAVRRYWERQFEAIDPSVEPLALAEDERGRVVVEVHQVVRDLDGNVLVDQELRHVYTFSEGLVIRMDIEG
jgi:hypothetical protein